MKRPKFIAGNWKMHTTLAGARGLASTVASGLGGDSRVIVAVFPPFTALTAVADVLKGTGVAVGAQNCHFEREGAFTGEVAAPMLVDAGCKYVILGHSERRHGLGETDETVNRKIKAAQAAGLTVIACVGETLAEREGNRTEAVLDAQVTMSFAGVDPHKLVVAYEPVWAIGTGKVASPGQAQDAHLYIRRKIGTLFGEKAAASLLILYGGSAKPENVPTLLELPDVDGGLVGGASLKADQFLAIIRAAV